MIPKVKRYRFSFYMYKTSTKPYAVIYTHAPTKTLAKLNIVHDPDTAGAYYEAIKMPPTKIVIGIVRK